MSMGHELPPRAAFIDLVLRALAEDLGAGDVTSSLVFAPDDRAHARIEAREALRVCGRDVVESVFACVDSGLVLDWCVRDGDDVPAGSILLRIDGRVRAILAGERTALNFLGRLCGVASHVRRFVQAVSGTGVAIVDTRKTLPGWRVLDKYAVRVGGGINHRMGLYDGILLKDNHLVAAGGVSTAVKRAIADAPRHLRVQVEVESLADARSAVDAGATFLLLDNRSPAELREIARVLRDRATLEASGGVTLANVREIAQTGVHRISIGALTHSAPNADLALEIDTGARS